MEICWMKQGTDPTNPLSFHTIYTKGNVCGYFSNPKRTAVTTSEKSLTTERVPGILWDPIFGFFNRVNYLENDDMLLFYKIKNRKIRIEVNLIGKVFQPPKVNTCLQMTANFKVILSRNLRMLPHTKCAVKDVCSVRNAHTSVGTMKMAANPASRRINLIKQFHFPLVL